MSTFSLRSIHTFILLAGILTQQAFSQATAEQIAIVQAEYDASQFSASYPDGFGIPLKAQAVLNVVYPTGDIQLTKPYTASAVSTLPTISINPLPNAVDTFKAPSVFTLILADANPLGHPDPEGNYRHFLENGASFGDPSSNSTLNLNPGSGTVVTAYAGPGPAAGEGPHRYAWLLFAQPSSFKPQANLTNASVGPGHWYLNAYVTGTGLGDLVAASFFTVENGHATYSLRPTPAINTASVVAAATGASNVPVATSTPNTNTNANTNAKNVGAGQYADLGQLFKSLVLGTGIVLVGILAVQ